MQPTQKQIDRAKELYPVNPEVVFDRNIVACKAYLQACQDNNAERDEFAIGFAEWRKTLRPTQMVSVWSKNGGSQGLFTLDMEQLLDLYKQHLLTIITQK